MSDIPFQLKLELAFVKTPRYWQSHKGLHVLRSTVFSHFLCIVRGTELSAISQRIISFFSRYVVCTGGLLLLLDFQISKVNIWCRMLP